MIVEIDVGNSRYKCRHTGVLFLFDSLNALMNHLMELPDIERVRIASVKSSQLADEIVRKCRIDVEKFFVAKTQKSNKSFTHCYQSTEALGVDRWLGMLAAIELSPKGCIVIDAGSALTIDVVSAEKSHLGGYIVPGIQIMRKSLFANTDKVHFDMMVDNQSIRLGDSTQSCVDNGVLLSSIALIDRVIGAYSEYRIVVSGGDADAIVKLISRPSTLIKELVLDGLSLADIEVSIK